MTMSNGPELRIGDEERETAITALGEHYAAGRLTKDEYDERAAQAWAARTRSALWPLFADLPRPEPERPAGPAHGDRGAFAGPFGARGSGPGRWGWWFGARMMPVLLIVLALVLLTKLPWFVLLIVVWMMWARLFRLWGFAALHRRQRGAQNHQSHGRW